VPETFSRSASGPLLLPPHSVSVVQFTAWLDSGRAILGLKRQPTGPAEL